LADLDGVVLVVSVEAGDAGLEGCEQVTGLEIPHVDSGNLGNAKGAMGADEWGNSRDGGKSSGEVHGGGCIISD
jgi:hypothetical protein